ncbi:FadR/GntR family transcriptional regulator [Phytohabitans houttuyneae]|uniref:GntR family transcriptional regulator n=1 Tax=Phytohabitans houttuyneae TaxID=1076126 RepID=A0A6V8KGZ4_9ACTN|nr:FCD domain-containing protein [Phytohabitans houttuyneae]GFJ83104.1 GntR family transcriptional regulator [Phytohabitans houttuyneae]
MTQPRRGASENQRALQEAIKELIVRRGLAPGSLLPTETELMAELSVSRHPLREAIKALQALGIVDIRHGLGTYVGTPSFSPLEAGLTFHSHLSLRGDLRDIGDLVQIREVLETGLVRQVLAMVDTADLDTLESAVATMEREAAEGRYSPEADWLFHKTLYAPLRNELISDLLRVFWSVFDKVNAELPRTVETPQVAAAAHRNILNALRDGDAQVLTAAVADHFNDIRERISRVPRR